MILKKNLLAYPVLLISASLLLFAYGCEKNDENDNGNGKDEISYGSVTDIEDNEYKTVVIGDQEWMAENLKVTKYNNGDPIHTGLYPEDWENTTEGAFAIYPYAGGGETEDNVEGIDSKEEMVEAYGLLYNWYAVDDSRGLCPAGWHVPDNNDYKQLTGYITERYDDIDENNIADKLKSCRQVNSPAGGNCISSNHPRWNEHEAHYGTNDFGFSALPGGGREYYGDYSGIGYGGIWWSADEADPETAFGWLLLYDNGRITKNDSANKNAGFSVRCVKD